MSETLGSLCDKLTIVKLKQFHTNDAVRMESLRKQELQLINEADKFISDSINGMIPLDRMVFQSHKIYSDELRIREIKGSIGNLLAKLAETNCLLWHQQEKVYEFEKVKDSEKNEVIKSLAVLNLERTKCIDEIDNSFVEMQKNER